ncbi:MAG TPA: hypothetical protein PLB32_00095, partial [Acidobacteriota bacterium]|nr:hypothetical protein [Acidobacteriota bacterium]
LVTLRGPDGVESVIFGRLKESVVSSQMLGFYNACQLYFVPSEQITVPFITEPYQSAIMDLTTDD